MELIPLWIFLISIMDSLNSIMDIHDIPNSISHGWSYYTDIHNAIMYIHDCCESWIWIWTAIIHYGYR